MYKSWKASCRKQKALYKLGIYTIVRQEHDTLRYYLMPTTKLVCAREVIFYQKTLTKEGK